MTMRPGGPGQNGHGPGANGAVPARNGTNGSGPGGPPPGFPPPPPNQGGGMRMGSFGMPTEKSKDFGNTARRLLRRLQQERGLVILALFMTVCSVSMAVTLPEIRGKATDVIVHALFTHQAIDFDHLGRILLLAVAMLGGS